MKFSPVDKAVYFLVFILPLLVFLGICLKHCRGTCMAGRHVSLGVLDPEHPGKLECVEKCRWAAVPVKGAEVQYYVDRCVVELCGGKWVCNDGLEHPND